VLNQGGRAARLRASRSRLRRGLASERVQILEETFRTGPVDLAAAADNTDFPSELDWKRASLNAHLAAPISLNWIKIG
jgi:hypothetical protein